ncbi:MAG: hypothetical protein VW270_06840, partial [Candidatus Poseidoniales archaeon]
MSRGKKLQEMEVKTQQSKSAVNASAKAADAMDTSVAGSYEDLGGPTPENYKPDDDSAKLKTPGGTLKQVKDVVTKGAKPAEAAKGMAKEEEELSTEDTIEEDQEIVDEVVEEETEETVEEYDVDEDVNALLGGEELSEEFKEKAKTIFEAAINAKVAVVKEELEAKYAAALEEQVA